ncbi:MAG: type II secretion system protein [Patescibacteria group bacterium]
MRLRKDQHRKTRGFTLIEMLVVIAILTIMSSLVMSNVRRGQDTQYLRQAADQLVQDIRTMQNYAAGGKTMGICTGTTAEDCMSSLTCTAPATCVQTIPQGGYGVQLLSLSSYVLYPDTFITTDLDPTDGDSRWYGAGDAGVVGTVSLTNGVLIIGYQYNGGACVQPDGSDSVFVTFEPPFAVGHVIQMTGGGTYQQDTTIQNLVIWLRGSNQLCRKITVNGIAGLVSEEQAACPALCT